MKNELISVDKKVVSKENMSILSAIKNINICELNDDEVRGLVSAISKDVNVNKMRKQVEWACKNLSQVGPVKFTAEAAQVARENQERIELIFKLLDSFGRFEDGINCMRRNKGNCRDDFDKVYDVLISLDNLADAVLEHSDFKIKEREENNRYVNMLLRKRERELEGNDRKLLKEGDE